MGSQICGVPIFLLLTLSSFLASALPGNSTEKTSNSAAQVSSNFVLVALLDSHYTELSELVEKALLLQTLEEAFRSTISQSSPPGMRRWNGIWTRSSSSSFSSPNLKSLQNLLLFHMIPARIESKHWPTEVNMKPIHHTSLCREAGNEKILLREKNGEKIVSTAKVVKSDDIIRPDGIIHGIERLLIPKSVQQDFNAQ